MSTRRVLPPIVTTHVYPPIPSRSSDWCARFGDEEDGFYGWGPTEDTAIADLMDRADEWFDLVEKDGG